MTLFAALWFAVATVQAGASPADQGIRCVYDTVGAERMQGYNAQIEAGTLTVQGFASATAADRRDCIQRGVWKHQSQVDTSFTFALTMARFVQAGNDLQKAGINPDDVLGRWDTMPTSLRGALKMGVENYEGGGAKFVSDLRTFLTSQTPAKQAPSLGHALELLSAYGEMLRAADDYASAGAAPTP